MSAFFKAKGGLFAMAKTYHDGQRKHKPKVKRRRRRFNKDKRTKQLYQLGYVGAR